MKQLCSTRDVPAGGCHRIELTDRPPLAVFNLDGRFYVTDDTCTHGDASLCDGEIDCDDGVVECPYHQGAFEIATGRPAGAPCSIPLPWSGGNTGASRSVSPLAGSQSRNIAHTVAEMVSRDPV